MDFHRRVHRIEGLISPRTRKRLRRLQSVESVEIQIERKLNELRKAKKHEIWHLIHCTEIEPWRTKLCKLLLQREDLDLDDIFELFSITDGSLLQESWRKLVLTGIDPDNLTYLSIHGLDPVSEWAFKELVSRIKKGVINKSYGIRILIRIIKRSPNKRTQAWRELKNLKPNREGLLEIIDLPRTPEMLSIIHEAEQMARKARKKTKPPSRTAKEIFALLERMREINGQG